MNHLSLKSYIAGFALSLLLTLVPYLLVVHEMAPRSILIPAVVAAAILQLFVQLGFFLHLSFKPTERDGLLSLVSTAIIILTIVFGSLWIMANLNYFMMDPVMQEYDGKTGGGGGHHGGHSMPPAEASSPSAPECHKADSVTKEGEHVDGPAAPGGHAH